MHVRRIKYCHLECLLEWCATKPHCPTCREVAREIRLEVTTGTGSGLLAPHVKLRREPSR